MTGAAPRRGSLSAKIAPIQLDSFRWYDHKRYSFSLGLQTPAGTYLSGHTASEFDRVANRMVVRGGMVDQVRTIYAKVGAILEAAQLASNDVTRIVEYIRADAIEQYQEAAAVRREFFGQLNPVVNTVPVRALLRPDALIEVEVTASASSGAKSGAVYLPSVQPLDQYGDIVGPDDVEFQLHAIYDHAANLLAGLGLGLDRVVKVSTYLASAPPSVLQTVAHVRRLRLGSILPAAVDVIMPRLIHPNALVQCDFIASSEDAVPVLVGDAGYDRFACSPAIRAGNLLYIANRGAVDFKNDRLLHEGDVAAQAERIYGNLLSLLRSAGGEPRHLVKTIEYVSPCALEQYRKVGAVRSNFFEQPFPVSTGLVSKALSRVGMQIDVDALAVLD